jgi:pimeloyl-ACP methyl ester carboxylesterase
MEPKFPAILTDDELRAITVPALLITGARSALLTPAQARARGSLMPHAEVAIVPGSHGGFDRINELNDRIAAFIQSPRHRQAGGRRFWVGCMSWVLL